MRRRDAGLTGLGVVLVILLSGGLSWGQLTCTGTVFDDVNEATVGLGFCGFIEQFSTLGITGGCSTTPPLYCPDSPVTRGQMAIFLTQVIGPSSTKTVNCPGQSLQTAVDAAKPGDIINVTGTCNEALNVKTDDLTLDGLGSAIIDGTALDQVVITITGAVRVVIRNLTVQNGSDGILATRQAHVTLAELVAQGNSQRGIRIDSNSTAALKNCMVQGSGMEGIIVRRSSNATFEGTIISQTSNGPGIVISGSSIGDFLPASNITAITNQGAGIAVQGSSELSAWTATIDASSNNNQGIFVDNSSVGFSDSTILTQGNQSWGVQLGHSTLKVSNGTMTSSGNQTDGMGIFEHSSFILLGNANVNVTQNARSGINLYTDSSISNLYNGTLSIQNNPKSGLAIFDGSSARLLNGRSTISGNPEAGLGLFRGSRVELAGNNVIDNTSNDNTVLINGILQNQPPVRTFAVCVNGSPTGSFPYECECSGGRTISITRANTGCSATSDAGTCFASGLLDGGSHGSCCVCAAE